MNTTEELEFARKIRRVLDQRSAVLPPSAQERLASARKIALSHHKLQIQAAPVFAGAPALITGNNSFHPWRLRLGMLTPLLIGLILVVGLYQYERQSHINAVADLDTAVLLDDLPIAAYTDHGFNSFLMKRGD
ncbi:MAG: DUF3619 family protein [Herbaspirillum sp.]